MVFSKRAVALAVSLASLLHGATVIAKPLDTAGGIDVSKFGLYRRQDPGPGGGTVDPSGIEPEDEDPAQIAADGTGPLRSAVSARPLYTNQPTATWYQVATGTTDAEASFTVFTTTGPQNSPIPAPDDPNQIRGPNPWNVDHIFELQVIAEAFKADKPSKIPQADWASASSAVFTAGPENSAIASAVTNLNNLQGIPNRLNNFKKQVFTGNLTGKGGPSSGDDATFFNFFGPAIQKYLSNNKDALLAGTVDETGNQIRSAAANNADVKAYFTSYASFHYQGCIDFLSTWSGLPVDRSTATPTPTPTTTAAGGSAVTCYHAADPQNTCAAIANGPGYCFCGSDPTTYAVMPSPATNPCGWTTTPPTTSFDCGAAPTSTCNVPAGCSNAAAPTGCAVVCT